MNVLQRHNAGKSSDKTNMSRLVNPAFSAIAFITTQAVTNSVWGRQISVPTSLRVSLN